MEKNKLSAETLQDPLLILESEAVLFALKKHWLDNHAKLTQPEKFVVEFFDWLKAVDAQNGHSILAVEIKKYYKKKLKQYWNADLPVEKPKDMFLEIIQSDLSGVETILDFGCGKLAYLKNMAEQNSKIKKFIGIDSKSQPVLQDLDSRIEFARDLDAVADASVDLVVVKLVLHHLQNKQETQNIFMQLRRVLRSGGKLIIFEESFPNMRCSVKDAEKYLVKFNLEMSAATQDFLQLSEIEKIKFLFLNDWLMNLQNTYMPWTGFYKSMEDWVGLVESVGFREKESHFLGAIKQRKRKQGMTAMLTFFQ